MTMKEKKEFVEVRGSQQQKQGHEGISKDVPVALQ